MITTEATVGQGPHARVPAVARPRARMPRRPQRATWAWSAALSVLAHAALVGAASFVPGSERARAPVAIELVMDQVDPVDSPPAAVPARVEPPAKADIATPRPPRRMARPTTPRPVRVAAVAPSAEPAPRSLAPVPPDPAPPVEETPADSGPTVVPGPATVAGTGLGGGPTVGGSVAASGSTLARSAGQGMFGSLRAYLEHVQARVARGQRYPQLAIRMGLDGVVVIRVRVHPDGTFAGAPAVATSCGHEVLDREAVRMVAQAAPFPPLPEGAARATELTVPVRFRLEE